LSSVAAAQYNGKYIVFGRDGVGSAESAKIPRYDIETKTWDYATDRPLPGNHHCVAQVGPKVYSFGGRWGDSAGQVQVYDFTTDTWEIKTPFDTVGKWVAGALSCGLINGKVVIAGGEVEGALDAYPYTSVYDIASDTWDLNHPDMPEPVHHATPFVYNNELWIMGGRGSGAVGKEGTKTTQVYNPETKTWRSSLTDASIPTYPHPVTATGPAVKYGGEYFIFGGGAKNNPATNVNNIFPMVRILNPATGVWRYGPDMITPREAIWPVLYKDRIFVVTSSRSMSWDYTGINEVLQLDAPVGGEPTATGDSTGTADNVDTGDNVATGNNTGTGGSNGGTGNVTPGGSTPAPVTPQASSASSVGVMLVAVVTVVAAVLAL
jgi:hypothetical protein